MITAISSVKQNSNLGNNANLKRTNQIAFTGSPISLLRSEGKISRLMEETTKPIGGFIKKILGKAELPFSKKSLTANADLTHFLPDGTPITIPMPEVHTAVTKVLDGANILKPDAADLAANALDALATKANVADAIATGADALSTKADVADAIATGADVLANKSDAVDAAHGVVGLVTKIIDTIF